MPSKQIKQLVSKHNCVRTDAIAVPKLAPASASSNRKAAEEAGKAAREAAERMTGINITVPQKGYAKRGSKKRLFLGDLKVT